MIEVYISLVAVVLFIVSIMVGLLSIRQNKKTKKYNFLNMFPYEMKSENPSLLLTFRSVLALFCGVCCIVSIYIFFVKDELLISRILSFGLLINSFLLLTMFTVDMRNYKLHLYISIIFSILNIINYALYGYLGIRYNFTKYPLGVTITCFILAIILLTLILLPTFKNWYLLKKDEDGNLSRGKIFPLAILEWINLISFVLLFLITGITYLFI